MDQPENELIDSHSHIYLQEFEADRESMLKRARNEGISRILLPAIDSATHSLLTRLAAEAPETCLPMMGLHPCSVKENYEAELKIVRSRLENGNYTGIGEIGLDFYWDKTFSAQQVEALNRQLEWCLEFDLAFSLHSRNATNECIDIVSKYQNGNLRGVFHCFSGDLEQAKKITGMGFYLGIGGVVTFKNGGLDKVLPGIALSQLVLETDAPYLAPVPFRGKRNEPAYLKYIVEKMALIKNISKEEVAKTTTQNARKIFGRN